MYCEVLDYKICVGMFSCRSYECITHVVITAVLSGC